MRGKAISHEAARRYYDRLAGAHDFAERYEGRAKARALALLQVSKGQHVVNVGVGTGLDHMRLVHAVGPGGLALGLDLSRVMLDLTRERTHASVCQADALRLPLADEICDRAFCAYVLDLLPENEIATVLAELYRILRPGGRIALVSLTDGTTLMSRGVIAVWRAIHAINPLILGGCRPVHLIGLVRAAGFIDLESETIVQFGIPSEIVAARR
ncbi:MAG: methyltransferase domain-containing protein [Chloroflexi bacterium]|nr:methyltransferase domain-containing protein [Chloroflexota bacterium]